MSFRSDPSTRQAGRVLIHEYERLREKQIELSDSTRFVLTAYHELGA